ncbi:helix-turn-helix domain-containing protein [Acetobacterium wieringae]|uniref:helix-turn-helix domain-containing protein n=1 Tax=Acetobacterium wieringae TaxID=52694 RepID=UPI0026E9C66C|nr:helix-turn-helix transcriptional regulator [Acetobacterium wieringae]
MLNFGSRLKQLRNSKQLTQQDLATMMGLSRATIAGYESTGKQPDQEKTLWLADYFNVSTDYLLGRTDDPTPIRDVNQDLYDEHDYTAELKSLIDDEEFRTEFLDFEDWTDEEKRNILFAIRANRALREKNEKN